ncbi:TonB-dependent receptor [Carboxylicivirga mesophila]|uniref:TonB-dependent receptor n=1 Tax=Carboxylicivirga mesophila TaxID=1166478 RepID=A0ABS5K5X9_9BACT|nr:TonB-dependent receptor [Carboxylicivirga mesophila]MBS2210351.1 TonB-dependent receptor [Carboxylicivirga mesophila]
MRKLFLAAMVLLCCFIGQAQSKQYTLSGYITDAGSGEKLINANVYEAEQLRGTVSNVYGFYSLTLPAGQYTIIYSYVGFKAITKTVNLTSDMQLNVNLDYAEAIEEVTVVGGAVTHKQTDSQMSKETLSMEAIERLPAFMGEADVMKTLQLMPGVQSGSEASSGLYVRGGGPDQNLMLLDGVPVYNASHLFGFFSVFNTDAVKNVSLYKGGFPARFGGRLSSVVDIRMKEGNEKEFHGGAQIGLISSRFFAEGPIVKDRTAFHVSARRTYIDLIARPFMNQEETNGYFFYDTNVKVNHKFSDKSRVYLSAYAGRDKAYNKYDDSYSYEGSSSKSEYDSKLFWGNITTALRWNYIFNNKLFANTTLTFSDYRFNVSDHSKSYENGIKEQDTFYEYRSGIEDWSAKIEFDWYPAPRHQIKFGSAYIYHTFKPGIEVIKDNSEGSDIEHRTIGNNNTYGHEMNVYIEDDFELTGRLKANLGLHASAFNVEDTWYTSLEPRASLRYLASDQITLKAAYSKMQQYLHLLSNSTIGLPTDLWLPVTKRVKPQVSHQYAIGAVYGGLKNIDVSLEGFYKEMDNLIEYKEGASFIGSSRGWEEQVEIGQGKAYGVELMLKKDVGNTTGWIGYTWSKTERQFDNLNFGEWFPARYDRRHDASIVLSHKINDKIDIGTTWVFGTGNAITLPTYEIERIDGGSDYNPTVKYYEHRNNYRMPNYHRMDVGINFHKQKKRGVRTWNISVYNVYNRKNPFFIYTGHNDGGKKVLKQVSLFPILPSITYSYKF